MIWIRPNISNKTQIQNERVCFFNSFLVYNILSVLVRDLVFLHVLLCKSLIQAPEMHLLILYSVLINIQVEFFFLTSSSLIPFNFWLTANEFCCLKEILPMISLIANFYWLHQTLCEYPWIYEGMHFSYACYSSCLMLLDMGVYQC